MSGRLDLIWQRFREVKSSYPEAILLLHIGDFYQALYEDAFPIARVTGSPVQRLYGKSRLLYCGFPCEQLEEMLSKLRMLGYRVIVRDQLPGLGRVHHNVYRPWN